MSLMKSEEQSLMKGDIAPDFSLKNVDNSTVSLSQFKGKTVVIIFMCNHCPYVKPKMQEIAEIQEKYKDKGVVVIGINSNDTVNYPEDSFENMQQAAKELGYDYYLLDETQDVARAYGAVCTPDPYIFNKDHKLAYHGRINNAMSPEDTPSKHDIQEVLDKLLSGEEPEEWFQPSMGCSIKWK